LSTNARLVAGRQEDRLPLAVESEGNAPFPICDPETQFLHLGVLRTLKRVGMWPTELGTVVGEKLGDREQCVLHVLAESLKLIIEVVMKRYIDRI
jgi:hypothetical protein